MVYDQEWRRRLQERVRRHGRVLTWKWDSLEPVAGPKRRYLLYGAVAIGLLVLGIVLLLLLV